MIEVEAIPGVLNYTVTLRPIGSNTPTPNSPYTLTEVASGHYQVNPNEFDNDYVVSLSRGAVILRQLAGIYSLRGGVEVMLGDVATSSDLTPLATSAQLTASIDSILAEGVNWESGGAADISGLQTVLDGLDSRLTDARAAKLDTVATTATANEYKADISSLSTFNPLTDVVDVGKVSGSDVSSINDFKADVSLLLAATQFSSGLSALESNIIATGNINWSTAPASLFTTSVRDYLLSIPTTSATPPTTSAIASAVELTLRPKLDTIAADALLGAIPMGDCVTNSTTAETSFTRNGVEVHRVRTRDENGALNPTRVFTQQVI